MHVGIYLLLMLLLDFQRYGLHLNKDYWFQLCWYSLTQFQVELAQLCPHSSCNQIYLKIKVESKLSVIYSYRLLSSWLLWVWTWYFLEGCQMTTNVLKSFKYREKANPIGRLWRSCLHKNNIEICWQQRCWLSQLPIVMQLILSYW